MLINNILSSTTWVSRRQVNYGVVEVAVESEEELVEEAVSETGATTVTVREAEPEFPAASVAV